MKVNVNSIWILYRSGKISREGVLDAVGRGWITREQADAILAGRSR